MACASGVASAEGLTKAQCADAYESAQRLDRAGKVIEATSAAETCANSACPEILRVDCVAWLSPLRARRASVVVEARGPDQRELFEVVVSVDGAVVQQRLDGRAFFIDPGRHVLAFASPSWATEEMPVVVREGEQGRRVVVTFGGESAPASRDETKAPNTTEGWRGLPTSSWVLGGVGLVGLGMFGGFGVSGKLLENTLEHECSPYCDEARVSHVRAQYLVADIALGIGIVSLGIAAWLAISHRSPSGVAR